MGTVVHLTDQSLQLSARNWDSVYSAVCSLSASWEETDSVVPLVTQYLSSNNVNIQSANITDLFVLSSLFVLGTATFIQTQTLTINDPIIYVAENNLTDELDIGLVGSWTNPNFQYGGLVRRADNKIWTLFSNITSQPLTGENLNWSQQQINLEPLSANFYGDIYGNRNVFGGLNINNGLTITGNISGNNLKTSFNQGSVIGNFSFAVGTGTAIGEYSTAESFNTIASGSWSHSEGFTTIALGSASHSEGNLTRAAGNYSHAEGNITRALGTASHVEGQLATATGDYSHAEGLSANSLGNSSHAEGTETVATGDSSHAEGYQTTASGDYSHSEGKNTQAQGNYSHAEGNTTIARDTASHAEGTDTQALGADSHAEGNTTVAAGSQSHAEGILSEAKGIGSHASGYRATAGNNYSYIWSGNSSLTQNISTTRTGQYMISAPGGVFIPGPVGIGTDVTTNALTVSGVIVARGGNSNLWNTGYDITIGLQNLSSSFVQNSTLSNLSGNWQTTFATVCSLSSRWGAGLDVAAVANYLSSNSLTLCSINVRGQILSAGTNLFDIFATAASAAIQTLNYNESSYDLTILGGNTVNLSSINTTLATNSANWQSTYYTVSSLSASWEDSADIIPTVANYLSTNNIFVSSLNVREGLSTASAFVSNNIVATNISATGGLFGRAQDNALNILSTNTVQNSTIALAISSLNNALQIVVPAPTYNLPVATLTNFSPSVFEIGANVSRNLILGFTQNEAGSPTQFEIFKNNVSLLAQTLPFTQIVNEPAALGTTTYRNTVTYGLGLVKNNILGLPDSRGQIQPGTVSVNQIYNGYFRRWTGSVTALPSNPNNVRTLTLSTSLDIDSNLNLASPAPIYIANKFILIVIPNTRILTNVVTDNNETLTSQFNLSSVQIQDAGGTDRAYKLYYLETALPLNATLTNITIANAP